MKNEGFAVGEQAIVRKGAKITSNNGADFKKHLSHEQQITIGQLLERW